MKEGTINQSITMLKDEGLIFSIDDLAKTLKVGKATIYQYFRTKEELSIAVLKLFSVLAFAYVFGKALSKIKLPAILGWLVAGMIFGPCLAGVLSQEIIDSTWYRVVIKILEGFAGVMIGSEIVFSDLKKYGAKTVGITLFQSLGTFLLVSAAFLVVFSLQKLPFYLAFIIAVILAKIALTKAGEIEGKGREENP